MRHKVQVISIGSVINIFIYVTPLFTTMHLNLQSDLSAILSNVVVLMLVNVRSFLNSSSLCISTGLSRDAPSCSFSSIEIDGFMTTRTLYYSLEYNHTLVTPKWRVTSIQKRTYY